MGGAVRTTGTDARAIVSESEVQPAAVQEPRNHPPQCHVCNAVRNQESEASLASRLLSMFAVNPIGRIGDDAGS